MAFRGARTRPGPGRRPQPDRITLSSRCADSLTWESRLGPGSSDTGFRDGRGLAVTVPVPGVRYSRCHGGTGKLVIQPGAGGPHSGLTNRQSWKTRYCSTESTQLVDISTLTAPPADRRRHCQSKPGAFAGPSLLRLSDRA